MPAARTPLPHEGTSWGDVPPTSTRSHASGKSGLASVPINHHHQQHKAASTSASASMSSIKEGVTVLGRDGMSLGVCAVLWLTL